MLDPRHPPAPAWIVAPSGGHPTKWHQGVHVLPYLDTREHEPHRACWCQPTQVERIEYPTGAAPYIGGTWQHHAADGRALDARRQHRLDGARGVATAERCVA